MPSRFSSPAILHSGGERGPVISPAFKAGDSVLSGSNGGFDSHTLPPIIDLKIDCVTISIQIAHPLAYFRNDCQPLYKGLRRRAVNRVVPKSETAQREHPEPLQVLEKLVAGVRFELTTFGL